MITVVLNGMINRDRLSSEVARDAASMRCQLSDRGGCVNLSACVCVLVCVCLDLLCVSHVCVRITSGAVEEQS